VVPARGRDELRLLAQAFNTMTRRLKSLMETKDRLLADVSHELRSPITRMKVATELLPEHPASTNIIEDLTEMETMVTELLDAARHQGHQATLKLEMVDLNALAADMAATLAAEPPGVVFTPLPDKLEGRIDPRQIRTVLKNIIENAQKYSAHQKRSVELSMAQSEEAVEFVIRDHGDGIAADALPHIFDPFYRVDPSRTRQTGGFGLGLSICRTIVAAHGGTIEIQSRPGQGTTVRVRLPNPQPKASA
jgi:signal transduction histidine kinase